MKPVIKETVEKGIWRMNNKICRVTVSGIGESVRICDQDRLSYNGQLIGHELKHLIAQQLKCFVALKAFL